MKSKTSLFQGYAIQYYILSSLTATPFITRDDVRLLFRVPSKVVTRQVERLSSYVTFDNDRIIIKPYAVGIEDKIEELSIFRCFSANSWIAGRAPKEAVKAIEEYLEQRLPGVEYSSAWQGARVVKADLPALEKVIPVLRPLTMAWGQGRPDVVFYLGEFLRTGRSWTGFKTLHPEVTSKQIHSLITAWTAAGYDEDTIQELPDETSLKLIERAAVIRKDYLASGYQPSKTVPDYDLAKYGVLPKEGYKTAQQLKELARDWHQWTVNYNDDEVPNEFLCLLPEKLVIRNYVQFLGDIDELLPLIEPHREVVYTDYNGLTILSDCPVLSKACLETFLSESFYLFETDLPSAQDYGPLVALPLDVVEKMAVDGKILKREFSYEKDQSGQLKMIQKLVPVSL